MPNQPGRPSKERLRQQQLADIQNAVPKELKEILLLLNKIYSQNAVLVIKIHNALVELSGLKDNLNGLLLRVTECLAEPQSQSEVQAILRDFLNHIKPKTK